VSGEAALDLLDVDLDVLGAADCGAGHPPIGALEPCRQVHPASQPTDWLRVACSGEYFLVRRFLEPDPPVHLLDDDGVEPPPDHDLTAAGRGREGHQVAGGHPSGARSRKERA
jgi:hypothetical protein